MAATTLSPVRETWTIIERTPRTSGLLGSIHRELEPGVVARTTDGEFYKLVTLRRHLGREPGTLWNVEWVTQTGAPLRRTLRWYAPRHCRVQKRFADVGSSDDVSVRVQGGRIGVSFTAARDTQPVRGFPGSLEQLFVG